MARRVSRRSFLQAATATTAAAYAARSLPAWASTDSATVDRGAVAVDTPLATFAYSDVQLLDGPMNRQFEENHARFLNLDDDRLLKVFRQVAGLPAPGADMGGWYDLTGFSLEHNDFHGFIAGHSFGQYLSGLARAYAVDGVRTYEGKSQSPGQGIRRNTRSQGQVLRRTIACRPIPTTNSPAA